MPAVPPLSCRVHSSRDSIVQIVLLLACFVFPAAVTKAQSTETFADLECTLLKDQPYGENCRNTFDIIIPKSTTATPLVIYIHGGGFIQGDKDEAFHSRAEDIPYFLKNNTAFASLNYRFYSTNDSIGVAACLKDISTALKYIRHHAATYNINKELIACYGSSAGAGSSRYLAFDDDLAVRNDTTLLGESTRLRHVTDDISGRSSRVRDEPAKRNDAQRHGYHSATSCTCIGTFAENGRSWYRT